MLARTRARRRALDVLHAADVTGAAPVATMEGEDLPEYARAIVVGVAAHLDDIDAVIRDHAEHWTIDRMPVVDRNVLRIALYELLFGGSDTPPGVAINEAVELAKLLSTEDSSRFVNGLLGRVARERGLG